MNSSTFAAEVSETRSSFAISCSGLTRSFGELMAVDNVTFSVAPGQFFGFLGPNGAGKSTTIKMLTGLLEPTRGEVADSGQRFSAERARAEASDWRGSRRNGAARAADRSRIFALCGTDVRPGPRDDQPANGRAA